MNNEDNIEVMNKVTSMLIDSYKGYQMCAEAAEENPFLKSQFIHRHQNRKRMVEEFQSKIAAYGGEIEDSGTLTGSLHRAYIQFTSLFQEDVEAAVNALDTGEQHLAEYIQDQLKVKGLTNDVSVLLTRAHASAVDGERFADLLDE